MELKKYKLSDVAKVEISSVDKKTKAGEIPVRLCNFTDVYHNWAITSDMVDSFMEASANPNEIEKFTIKKGQVAFTKDSETRNDIGISTYIADDFYNILLGYHCALITPDETKLCGKYLNAFMHSTYIQKYFENSASGSGQRYTLSLETINSMPILLPSLDKQKRIGEIFTFLDNKIKLNRAINQNLEAMAKQLYDYWFVQFDFPDENGRPYKSSGGKMVWNEKLHLSIPSNWEAIPLSEIMDYAGGSQPPASEFIEEYRDGYIRFVQIRDYYSNSHITYIPIRKSNKLCTETDIMIARYGASLGRICYGLNGAYNVALAKVSPKVKEYTEYLRIFLMSDGFYNKINSIGQRAAQAGFNKDDIENILIPFPTNNRCIIEFNKTMQPYFFARLQNDKEINTLTKQRDELLPLLMNGQATVNSDLSAH